MRSARLLAFALSLLALPAAANPEFFFGTGVAPTFREEDLDKRFVKTRLYQALNQGTPDTNCVQLVGAMLTLLGSKVRDVAPADAVPAWLVLVSGKAVE